MRATYLLAAIGLLGVSMANAENGVLVDHVPGGADPAIVIAVTRQALVNRKWTVENVDAVSVSAEIESATVDAKIRIILSKNQLIYEGSAIKYLRTNPNGPPIKRNGNVPKNWLAYLRRDIATQLALMPETPR